MISTSKPSRLDEAVRAWTPGSYNFIGGYNPRPHVVVDSAAQLDRTRGAGQTPTIIDRTRGAGETT